MAEADSIMSTAVVPETRMSTSFVPSAHGALTVETAQNEIGRSREPIRFIEKLGVVVDGLAIPLSLSIDDHCVTVMDVAIKRVVDLPTRQVVSTPDNTILMEKRIEQVDMLIFQLEDNSELWRRADLLLKDAWLNSYKAQILEASQDFGGAIRSFERAIKLYALALKADKLTARSSPHIIWFYHMLRRYSELLRDERLDEEYRDLRRLRQLYEHMEVIRSERSKWELSNPEELDDPFAYPELLLKVLCS